LAVAAIGKLGEFPLDSYHAQTIGAVDGAGFFSPKFTCYGPEITVCAPGVAILSSVPPNNYAVWDGTSMAAAHVTGLAALVLAHHPDFQGLFKARNAARVDRLFQILRASAHPLNLGDPRRTGFGMPDVLVALGLAPGMLAGSGVFGELFSLNPAAAMYARYPEFGHFGQPVGFAPSATPYQHGQIPVGTW
jgi:subtilisin family serine protease